MNEITGEFAFVYADGDEIVETKEKQIVLTRAPVTDNMQAKPLNGYENTMRRHAAACEAGR